MHPVVAEYSTATVNKTPPPAFPDTVRHQATRMSRPTLFFLFMATLLLVNNAHADTHPTDLVWHECANGTWINVKMKLDGNPFYSAQMQLCHQPLASFKQASPPSEPAIHFYDPTRSAFGEPRGTLMRGDIWEAENQRDSMLLRITFTGPDNRLWFSGTHRIDPFKVSETRLGNRLTIKTYPTPTAHLNGTHVELDPDPEQ
jgi:hypothetical protein